VAKEVLHNHQLLASSKRLSKTARAGIAKRIRKIRHDQGMQQIDVARAVGANQRSVSFYESGVALPRIDILLNYSDFGGVTVDWILRG
jgi:transcriptional regulator with XRE-family HTH domain